jgi:hypothetical protein
VVCGVLPCYPSRRPFYPAPALARYQGANKANGHQATGGGLVPAQAAGPRRPHPGDQDTIDHAGGFRESIIISAASQLPASEAVHKRREVRATHA